MTIMDVASLIKDVEGELKDVIKFATEVVATLDADASGDVSADEFLRCLAKEPLLLQTFQSCVQVTVRCDVTRWQQLRRQLCAVACRAPPPLPSL